MTIKNTVSIWSKFLLLSVVLYDFILIANLLRIIKTARPIGP